MVLPRGTPHCDQNTMSDERELATNCELYSYWILEFHFFSLVVRLHVRW